MSSNNAIRKAKHDAFVKKQEEKGKKVVRWIFGVLVALGVAYLAYMVYQMN